jgi:hypothetical protein
MDLLRQLVKENAGHFAPEGFSFNGGECFIAHDADDNFNHIILSRPLTHDDSEQFMKGLAVFEKKELPWSLFALHNDLPDKFADQHNLALINLSIAMVHDLTGTFFLSKNITAAATEKHIGSFAAVMAHQWQPVNMTVYSRLTDPAAVAAFLAPCNHLLLYRHQGKVAAGLLLSECLSSLYKGTAYISNLAQAEIYKESNFHSLLIDHALGYAQKIGLKAVYILVSPHNFGLYKDKGFIPVMPAYKYQLRKKHRR